MSVALQLDRPKTVANSPHVRRVLLITQASGGGVGRHFLDLAEGLVARGIEVCGIYSPRKLDTMFRERLAGGGLPPMHALPMRRAVHPLDVLDLSRLIGMMRRLGPFDVVHGHSSKGGALARLAARWLGIPSVYTAHAFVTMDPNLPAMQRLVYGRIERWLAHRTATVIAVSEDEALHAQEELGIDERTVRVVPNGISELALPSRDEVRARLGLSGNEFVIGFVGRLSPQKAPDVMLAALAKLRATCPRAKLVMIGSGPLDAEVRQQVEQLGIGAQVQLLGDVVAPPLMPAFDAFCLSSRYEGLPYVLLEALAAGLPIVATRVGGVTTCVEPNENGLIVTPENPDTLAAALGTLAADPALQQRFAAASAVRAAEFTVSRMVERTIEVYDRALQRLNVTRS